MFGIIQLARNYFAACRQSSLREYELSLSGKTHILNPNTPPAVRSAYQEMLKSRLIRERSKRSFKNTQPIYTTRHRLTVIYPSGRMKVSYYGTQSRQLRQARAYLTTGMSGLTLQLKSYPYSPHEAGSFLSFSARWPDVISRELILPRIQWSLHPTRAQEEILIVEIHSSGRVYSRQSTIS